MLHSFAEVLRHLEVTESTFNRWRAQYDGMKAEEAKRLKTLEGREPAVEDHRRLPGQRMSDSRSDRPYFVRPGGPQPLFGPSSGEPTPLPRLHGPSETFLAPDAPCALVVDPPSKQGPGEVRGLLVDA